MKTHPIRNVYHGLLLVLLLSACQPIRPEASTSNQRTGCSDQEKIALFREAVANTFDTGDFAAAVDFYAADGALIVDMPPALDAATGTYTVTGQVEGKGPDELMNMTAGSYETKIKMSIDQIRVEGDLVIAQMTGVGAWYQEVGMPTDTAHPIFTAKFNADCKAQIFTVTYPDEFLQTLQKH